MVEYTSISKCLGGLIQCGADHKTAAARSSTASCICHLFQVRDHELRNPQCREILDLLLIKVGKFVGDSSPDVRVQARELIRRMINGNFISRTAFEMVVAPNALDKALQEQSGVQVIALISRVSAASTLHPILTVVSGANEDSSASSENTPRRHPPQKNELSVVGSPRNPRIRQTGSIGAKPKDEFNGTGGINSSVELGVSGHAGPRQHTIVQNGSSSPIKYSALQTALAKKQMESMDDLAIIPELLQRMSNKNWLERTDAITQITDVVITHADILTAAGKFEIIIESLLEKLDDGSIKARYMSSAQF